MELCECCYCRQLVRDYFVFRDREYCSETCAISDYDEDDEDVTEEEILKMIDESASDYIHIPTEEEIEEQMLEIKFERNWDALH